MGCMMAANNLAETSEKVICGKNYMDFALKENALLK